MKNLTDTITNQEIALLNRVRDLLIDSPLYKDYGDKDRLAEIPESKWVNYRKGIVTIPLVDNCFRTGGYANMKQFAVNRVNNLVKAIRDGQKIDVKWMHSDNLCDSVDFCIENYHAPKTIDLPKTYGKDALNGLDKKATKLAAIIKELWTYTTSDRVYSIVFYSHEDGNVVKSSNPYQLDGCWKYSYENTELAALIEASHAMIQVRDTKECKFFAPDSATIFDNVTKDQYSITL